MENEYICSGCNKEVSPFDDDHYQVCKPYKENKMDDQIKHELDKIWIVLNRLIDRVEEDGRDIKRGEEGNGE